MNRKTIIFAISMLAACLMIGWLISGSYADVVAVLHQVSWFYLFCALAASAATYVFIGLSLWETLKLLGYRLNPGAAISIAFVSTTVNYFVSSLGASGFALRAHLLRKRNVPFGKSVTASVVITMLLYFVLALMVLLGCVFLVIHSSGSRSQLTEGFAGVVALLTVCFIFGMAFFNHEFRARWIRKLFRMANHIIYFFAGNMIPQESFEKFEEQLETGIRAIHEKKSGMTGALAYVCCDWIFTTLVLYMSFKAVGYNMPIGEMIAGFGVGMVTTIIPVLPGGLGAMELTMTAAYSKLGVPWHIGLVATLLYRVCYYFVPAVISIFIYWGLKISEPLDLSEELREARNI